MAILGRLYHNGFFVDQDYAPAMRECAMMYCIDGGAKNYAEAVVLYEMAFRSSANVVVYDLRELFSEGYGKEKADINELVDVLWDDLFQGHVEKITMQRATVVIQGVRQPSSNFYCFFGGGVNVEMLEKTMEYAQPAYAQDRKLPESYASRI